jgi:hypothetical protein
MTSKNSVTGYMAFAAEPPLIGLDPHPGFSPNEEMTPSNAAGWAECYSVYASRKEVQSEVDDAFASMRDSVARGDMEDMDDPDVIYPVSVDDDGNLVVYTTDEREEEIARYSAAEVFDAFGMSAPAAPPDQPEP